MNCGSRFAIGQGRVADTRCLHSNTTLPNSQPKMADAIFGLGLSHAPESSSVFARKNGEIVKVTAVRKEVVNGSH